MKVIYPGSFNPWTLGHQSILNRCLELFEEVQITVAMNPDKDVSPGFITWTLKPLESEQVTVDTCYDLVSQYGLPIVRGVRSGDWEYEQNLAQWNRELGVETLFLCPDPSLAHVNSTAVRTLHHLGQEDKARQFVGNDLIYYRWLNG